VPARRRLRRVRHVHVLGHLLIEQRLGVPHVGVRSVRSVRAAVHLRTTMRERAALRIARLRGHLDMHRRRDFATDLPMRTELRLRHRARWQLYDAGRVLCRTVGLVQRHPDPAGMHVRERSVELRALSDVRCLAPG
jgi:hypothetical protein